MRILVTGATGFIGTWILRALSKTDAEVWAASRRPPSTVAGHRINWKAVDLLDVSSVDSLIGDVQPDMLIHCAWETTPGQYWQSDSNLQWVSATLALFRAFEKFGGRRVVVAGTSAEYCWRYQNLKEGEGENPTTLYGRCKNSTRLILEEWCNIRKVSMVWCRVFCPFGAGESRERLIPKVTLKLLSGETVPLDSCRSIRDFLHVEDLAIAFVAVAKSDVCGPINLASGQGRSIREAITAIARHLGREDQVVFDQLPDRSNEPERIVADTGKLREHVNWESAISFKQRIAETCDWWMSSQSIEG